MSDNQGDEHAFNVEHMWCQMGLSLPVAQGFATDIDWITQRYRPNDRKMTKLPAKECKTIYRKLDKAVTSLRDQISDLPTSIRWELEEAGMVNEPADYFENAIGADHEGLDYGEYLIDVLKETLPNFHLLVGEPWRVTCAHAPDPSKTRTLKKPSNVLALCLNAIQAANRWTHTGIMILMKSAPTRDHFSIFCFCSSGWMTRKEIHRCTPSGM